MAVHKIRWSKVYESSEEELLGLFENRNILAERQAGEADSPPQQLTTVGTATMWCAEGSLSVRSSLNNIALQPGDAWQLPAHTDYTIHPGIAGYVYYLS